MPMEAILTAVNSYYLLSKEAKMGKWTDQSAIWTDWSGFWTDRSDIWTDWSTI